MPFSLRMSRLMERLFLARMVQVAGTPSTIGGMPAMGIADPGQLHLDDVGPEVPQEAGGEGAGEHGAQVDDPHPRQRPLKPSPIARA